MSLSETLIAAINRQVFLSHVYVGQPSQARIKKYRLSKSERRMLEERERMEALHDALAEILVRDDQSERVAVGTELAAHGLKIFIAADQNKDLDVLGRQLRDIWDGFRDIKAASCDPDSPDELRDEMYRKYVELRSLAYGYSWKKHVRWYNQYRDSIRPLLSMEIPKGENSPAGEPDGPRESNILEGGEGGTNAVRLLQASCKIMDKYSSGDIPDISTLNELAQIILLLNQWVRTSEELEENPCILSRWATLCSIDAIPDFIKRFFSTERAIRDVEKVLLRSRNSALLNKEPDVVLVAIKPVLLKYNVLDDPNVREVIGQDVSTSEIFENAWREDTSGSQDLWKLDQTVYPHCECALVAYLASNAQTEPDIDSRPYGFIGVSGPSCLACWMYLSVLNGIPDEYGLPEFSFSKSHAEVYSPWAKPEIPDRQLNTLVDSRLHECARDKLIGALRSEEDINVDLDTIMKQLRQWGDPDDILRSM